MIENLINNIVCGDCLDVMRKMPDNSVDLVVTSPPYNLLNSTGGGMKPAQKGRWTKAKLKNGYDTYDDNMPYNEYCEWQRECLTEMMRIIKDTGAIYYNHKWRVQNGLLQDRREIIQGFPVRQIIIWNRKGSLNFNLNYYLPCYEVIYLIAKKDFRLNRRGVGFGDVWEFQYERNNDHPAPFPVKLIDRIIASTDAEIVLDPFAGSGTTAIAAINNGRKYIGIEISEKYCESARKRISGYKQQLNLFN